MKFENVVKLYNGKKVLDSLSFEAEKGKPVCLFGESGSGKTTALNIAAGLCKADGGSITGAEGRISYVFQEDRLLEWFTAEENIMMTAVNIPAVKKIINVAELEDCLNMYPLQMSGGLKKRTAIARAVGYDGDIILLDEPFNGIDNKRVEAIAEFMKDFIKDKICIVVTHNKHEADILGAKIIKII